jgi:hypothetical protein
LGAALAPVLASVLLCGPAPVAAAAGTPGYCSDANGVTVVVDFQELGGSTTVRCAPGDQPTGLAALQHAGFTATGTAKWGLAFVCRIDGKPGPDAEKCIDTPPTSAYWSYWYASDGGAWTYSDRGATSRKPPLGSFEGWSFSLNKTTAPQPRVAPRRPAAPPAPPVTQNPPPAQPAPGQPPPAQGGRGTAAPGGAPAGPGGSAAAPSAQPGAGAPSTEDPLSPGAASTSTGGSPGDTDADAGSGDGDEGGSGTWTGDVDEAAHQGSGSPTGLLVGAALVLLLAAAAVVIARRRRASGGP